MNDKPKLCCIAQFVKYSQQRYNMQLYAKLTVSSLHSHSGTFSLIYKSSFAHRTVVGSLQKIQEIYNLMVQFVTSQSVQDISVRHNHNHFLRFLLQNDLTKDHLHGISSIYKLPFPPQ